MSDAQTPASAPPPAPPATPAPARPGCLLQLLRAFGRLLLWLLTLALTLLSAAGLLWWALNGPLATPAQLAQLLPAVATDRAAAAEAQTAAALRVAELEARLSAQSAALDAARERVDVLETGAGELVAAATAQAARQATISALSNDLAARADRIATVQALNEADQVTRAVMATMQVADSRRIDDLVAQTERLNRFVSRLADLAAALSIADAAPPAASPEPATPTPTTTPTPTPTARP